MSNAGDLITRVYSGFRGVDFRGEEINIIRSLKQERIRLVKQ